mmetsp:Transcript_27204/g.51013  ORF Transcript_27204/g.51013 Transcript_27204/m.51013 type:complete len:454 (-) Transcript_27204:278-1639(-)
MPTSSPSSSSSFEVKDVVVVNEAKAKTPIRTGIGFFDHMLDQWNSHAQVGVGLEVVLQSENSAQNESESTDDDRNRLATKNQVELCTQVGQALGLALKQVFNSVATSTTKNEARFSCPLDEALVECIISGTDEEGTGKLEKYTLSPYGIYPKGVGRTNIGKLETFAIESFWEALAKSSNLQISFRKLRGDNGHHIVESSFKAFSRALRNYLDPPDLWEQGSPNDLASVALKREGKVERQTKETCISVNLMLNGMSKDTHVETGIPMLNAFYTTLAQEAHMTLRIDCKGDLFVDEHHTAEDVSIAVGQCLTQALGSKAGLNRMWVAEATHDGSTSSKVQVTMDLSNRPCLVHNLHDTLGRQEYVDEKSDDLEETLEGSLLTCEMLEHSLESLVMNGRMTVHIVESKMEGTSAPASVEDVVLCTAMAFGRALRVCSMVDQRRAGTTASSKGTLSV